MYGEQVPRRNRASARRRKRHQADAYHPLQPITAGWRGVRLAPFVSVEGGCGRAQTGPGSERDGTQRALVHPLKSGQDKASSACHIRPVYCTLPAAQQLPWRALILLCRLAKEARELQWLAPSCFPPLESLRLATTQLFHSTLRSLCVCGAHAPAGEEELQAGAAGAP